MPNLIIQELAQLPLSQDLLRQVDTAEVINDFRRNFKRLDDFKKVRDQHSSRGFGKKVWDLLTFDSTLENAQLDAVEVQANFSKSIGQLMVLSIIQAQQLQQHQLELQAHQNTMDQQTSQLVLHQNRLAEHHADLEKKSEDLNNLVNSYFEIRGLTQEGAKKLIAIANDVKSTRDQLLTSVEQSISTALARVGETETQIRTEAAEARRLADQAISQALTEIGARLEAQTNEVGTHLAAANEKVAAVQEELGYARADTANRYKEITRAQEALRSSQAKDMEGVAEKLREQSAASERLETSLAAQDKAVAGLSQKLNALTQQFSVYQQAVGKKIWWLQMLLGASLLGSGGLLAFILLKMH